MRPFLERPVANPSSQHGPGRAARAAVETAREQVAALVGADPAQVIFTSGGTEADNLAIKGTVLLREPGARHLVVLASHKLGGPTGVGALVTRAGLPLRPLVHGGGQERGMRSGTLPVAAVVGFGAAAALALAEREAGAGSLLRLRQRLLDGLRAVEPDLEVNGDLSGGLPGLLSVRLPGRRSEDVLLLLDRDEVACSAGSACA